MSIRRITALFLSLVLMLSLIGCVGEHAPEPEEPLRLITGAPSDRAAATRAPAEGKASITEDGRYTS